MAADARRKLASGADGDSHFTLATHSDDDAVVHAQGWGYKPPLPDRLQQRLYTLHQQHHTWNSKMDQSTKQAKAAANRHQLQHDIKGKLSF